MKDILVVYNICGISNREYLDDYTNSIKLILEQDFNNFDLVVSSCLNKQATINSIRSEFQGSLYINHVKECHPVNVTFNHAVKKCIEMLTKHY